MARWVFSYAAPAVLAAALSQSAIARAESAEEPPASSVTAPAADAETARPRLLTFVEAPYPAQALAEKREGNVLLRLTVDSLGNVTSAELVTPLGDEFDEAAQRAALGFRFSPARRRGMAVAARILYRYEFHLPPEPRANRAEIPLDPAVPAPGARETPKPFVSQSNRSVRSAEIVVRGQSAADRLRQSAEAVTVIETKRARRESADLGEVLARTSGVGVQREGGLGSNTRFSLNGLTDDQVRFFLDGVPLDLSGYPFGVANVPVNLLERVEIYSGVVPVRFGADALGGAVNLVADHAVTGTHASASYELGSFDTHRLTLSARHLDQGSGLFARVNGFADYSRNDYPVEVEAPDEKGRPVPTRVYRFHDAYRADGGNAEFGVVNRPWAKHLLARIFLTDYSKDYQNNVTMTVPYGGVNYSQTSGGSSVRYEQTWAHALSFTAIGGLVYTRGRFLDDATCVYDWFGRCGATRATPGETDTRPHDSIRVDRSAFARAQFEFRPNEVHALRVTIAPTYLTRTGEERLGLLPGSLDPLSAEQNLLTLVNGAEYQTDLFTDRLENVLLTKQYVQRLASEEPRPGNVFRRHDRTTDDFGVGDSLRYRFASFLYAKAAYEYATRLPRPEEVFGDSVFVVSNLDLRPERSHNLNLGLTLDARDTGAGSFRTTVNGFLRDARDLIVILGDDRTQSYQNVFRGRSLGVEGAVGWTTPGDYLALDANATYQDFRNTSSEGEFGAFDGDRIPNRPYLFGTASARLQFRGLFSERDELGASWNTHYVHDYFRTWESVGLRSSKQVIPSQLVHSVGFGYRTQNDHASLSTNVEIQNLTDEAVFDFFGVQKPGRAIYFKTTVDL